MKSASEAFHGPGMPEKRAWKEAGKWLCPRTATWDCSAPMHQVIHRFAISTKGRGLVEITPLVAGWLAGQDFARGLLTLFCRHTSASLLIQENADPDVQTDLEAFFAELAPEDPDRYIHRLEGPDDMPAHIRAAVTQTHLAIPVDGRRMMLGTWQGIYLFEHRTTPHRREIVAHLIGE